MDVLQSPEDREPVHTRAVLFQGYCRKDGLWDVEADLQDSKSYDFETRDGVPRQAGEALHHMKIRMTVDDSCTVRALQAVTARAPFPECQAALPPLQGLVGVRLGKGWRNALERELGGVKGCTHVRELLFNMATAAFQTVPHYIEVTRGRSSHDPDEPPPYMGACLAWDFEGPVVKRVAPEFAGYRITQMHVTRQEKK